MTWDSKEYMVGWGLTAEQHPSCNVGYYFRCSRKFLLLWNPNDTFIDPVRFHVTLSDMFIYFDIIYSVHIDCIKLFIRDTNKCTLMFTNSILHRSFRWPLLALGNVTIAQPSLLIIQGHNPEGVEDKLLVFIQKKKYSIATYKFLTIFNENSLIIKDVLLF
jgi:hypothetical protein